MRIAEIIADLNAKKAEMGLTNQQIADISRVPKPTVDRVLRGGTDEPRAQTLLDIAAVFNYDLIQTGRPGAEQDVQSQKIAAIYEAQISDLHKALNVTRAEKNRTIRVLGGIVAFLAIETFVILLFDALNPTVGWFRGTAGYTREQIQALIAFAIIQALLFSGGIVCLRVHIFKQ